MSTKEEIFNYVMETPGNTNPAVLKSMLDGIEGGSGNLKLIPYKLINYTNEGVDPPNLFNIIGNNLIGEATYSFDEVEGVESYEGYCAFSVNFDGSYRFYACSLVSQSRYTYTITINEEELSPGMYNPPAPGRGISTTIYYRWEKYYTPEDIPDSIIVIVKPYESDQDEPGYVN